MDASCYIASHYLEFNAQKYEQFVFFIFTSRKNYDIKCVSIEIYMSNNIIVVSNFNIFQLNKMTVYISETGYLKPQVLLIPLGLNQTSELILSKV